MADISKIKTLDGTTYNIKDASARSSIPAAATVAPKMDGTAAVGSSAKYAKEDHVHPSDNTKLNYDAALFTTNSFAPSETRSLYISQINNAFFALDKRYSVSVVYDGDPISNVAQFFDGSYEGNNLRIQPGKSAVFTLDFSNGSGSKFAGYPYGYIYITFYAGNIPASITGRVYNNYASQTVGWKTLTFEQFGTSMFRARQDYYGLQTLEITMVGSGDTSYGYTSPVEIEFHATRPDPVEHSSIITKYGAQKLYYPLTAPSFIGSLTGNATSATKATQDESGNNIKANYAASMSISDHTITLKNKNGTSLGTVTVPDDNTTYTANTSKLVTTTVPNVTAVGSAPSLSYTARTVGSASNWNAGTVPTLGTAISADDITSWTTNVPTQFSVSGETLNITTGTAASLAYAEKTIPNITSVGTAPSLTITSVTCDDITSWSAGSTPTLGAAVTVATGGISSSGDGATVATGITAS